MPSPASFVLPRLSSVLVASTLISAGVGLVGPIAPAPAATDTTLVSRLDSVLDDSRAQRAKTGVVVLDGSTGSRLYSRQSTRAVIPASNTKVLTAVAALHTLGPDYRFRTEVVRRGDVASGTLDGSLYLKGYGDPTSRQRDYARLADQVRAAGIRKVTGRLVVDASFFDTQRYHPDWATSYASEYYAAQASALTVAPNADLDSGTVIVNFRPGTRGRKAKLTTTPAAAGDHLTLVNRTTTSSSGSATTVSASRASGSNTITVRGRVPAGRSPGGLLVSVDRPDLYAGAVFRAELERAGVEVKRSTKAGPAPLEDRTVVATDTSITLSALLVPFLKLSNNAHAEALTKTMGAESGPGSWPAGVSHTMAYLQRLGVPMDGVRLVDGSGLSRRTRLTPAALAAVLFSVQQEPWFADFSAALPVAGNPDRMVGGTLRSRMTGTAAADNARAKTGSLTGVTSLSGYVRGADGTTYVFAIISNYTGSSPRPVENNLVIRLAGHRR